MDWKKNNRLSETFFFSDKKRYPLNVGGFTSVADPVHFIRIRIRGSGFKNPDPGSGGPKRQDPTGSGSGSYLDMFLMLSKINNFCMAFSYQI